MDPRIKAINLRLRDVKSILPVVSGKGGVGKSLFSTTLALQLRSRGFATGLMDLDFHGASDHVILNAEIDEIPQEEKGVVPPQVHGLKFMSIVYYTQNNPLPIRGEEISDALIELLSITRWGKLDFLVIDMPPGLGAQLLDLLRFLRGRYIVITTPSILSLNVVEKLISLLKDSNVNIEGIVENMSISNKSIASEIAEKHGIRFLGSIPFYSDIEGIIGEPERMISHEWGKSVGEICDKITQVRLPR